MNRINETIKACNSIVRKYNIIGTNIVVYNAYEPTMPFTHNRPPSRNHRVFIFYDDRYYGKVGTRRTNDRDEQYARAYMLINNAFPETINAGRKAHGVITITIQGEA